MIDLRLLREDPDRVRASQRARGEDVGLVDSLLSADERRRSSGVRFDELRAEQKQLGKLIPKAQGDEKQELLKRTGELAAAVKAADAEQSDAAAQTQDLLRRLGNLVHPDVPVGGEEDFALLETHGTIRDFEAEGFAPKDHLELGHLLGAIDVERAAKVSGSRFYYLSGIGALLELALVNAAIAQATAAGFTPMLTPALVRPQAMDGTGFLGQAGQDVYHLKDDDLYLVGTSEVALAGYHMDEIIETSLGLPFRVIDVATGDLGSSAARKFDCEAWIPTQGKYRELTSTSDCTEFQARRLSIRMRDGKKTRPLATLNGTLCAVPRTIVALLENHQQADGSVRVPEVLRPYLGGREVLEPVAPATAK
ncbi:serine--tRNA ligase [Streptomyces sp. NEAU-H3]|uniref:serine--tRNA ligase n=1 Tax=Streptomyces sp. NEAU-H3 TaxID=2720636 RepID=UPI0014396B52|nr:serine--tRNA ligase [Streptomyces sp. NEAU-H3]NJA56522.1 serine--tRNA ligase [Streptomyces sp. NEAU-H3]